MGQKVGTAWLKLRGNVREHASATTAPAVVLPRLGGSADSPRWVNIFPQSLPPRHASALLGPSPSPPQYSNGGSCLPRRVLLRCLRYGSVVDHPQMIRIEYVLWPPAYTALLHGTLTGRADIHCSKPFGLVLNNELFVADEDKFTLVTISPFWPCSWPSSFSFSRQVNASLKVTLQEKQQKHLITR
jgi:hypothetical protein